MVEQTWWLGIPAAALIGVVLGASPLAWPLLGTAIGLGAGQSTGRDRTSVRSVAAFGGGITVVYMVLGALAGSIDDVLTGVLAPVSGIGYLVLAVLMVGMALVILRRDATTCSTRATRGRVLGAFGAGIPAGVVNCPACAGVITGVAASSAVLGRPVYSVAVMAALGVGHTASLVFVSWLAVDAWTPPRRLLRGMQTAGAVLLLLAAGWFVRQAILGGVTVGPRLP